MRYTGGCHCGNVAFEVEGTIDAGMACNCSICSKKGSLLWFVPRGQLTVHTPQANAASYLFNKHVINHHFCRNCGIHPYAEGKNPDGTAAAAINLRCIDDLDLATIPVRQFDGRSM